MSNRRAPENRRGSQLLLRLTSDEFDVLDAAAHLSRETPSAYAYQLLRAHIEVFRNDVFISQDLENRRNFERSQGSVAALRKRADMTSATADDAAAGAAPSS